MQKMTKEVLDKIRKYIETLCIINEDTLQEKISEIPKRQHEIFTRFAYECNELNNLDMKLKKKYGDLYKHYKYGDNRNWDTKGEIESQIYADTNYQVVWRQYNEQTYIVKELEGILNNIKVASFQIKNMIDLLKFKAGMY